MLHAMKSLPPTIWLLGLVSLFNDAASELVYPLVPLYLASVLMAGPKALGIIEGIAEATGSLLKLFSGVVAINPIAALISEAPLAAWDAPACLCGFPACS